MQRLLITVAESTMLGVGMTVPIAQIGNGSLRPQVMARDLLVLPRQVGAKTKSFMPRSGSRPDHGLDNHICRRLPISHQHSTRFERKSGIDFARGLREKFCGESDHYSLRSRHGQGDHRAGLAQHEMCCGKGCSDQCGSIRSPSIFLSAKV